MRLMRTVALFWPTSEAEKGCRTQLVVDTASASIIVTCRPCVRPHTRIAWSRYGNPITTALPLPPAPMTRMRTSLRCAKSGGNVCSVRMSSSFSAHELRKGLGQRDQGVAGKRLALVGEFVPQPFESATVARQAADVGVGKGAFVKAALPSRDRRHRRTLRPSHRAGAYLPTVRQVPERSNRQLGLPFWPLVLGQRSNREFAVRDAPHQRGLGKRAPVQRSRFAFGVLEEHLATLTAGPPHDHLIAFGENVLRQYLGRRASAQRPDQRFEEGRCEGLRGTKRRRCLFLSCNLMPRDKAFLPVSIDEQRLTQLEAMVLPDRDVYLHGVSPTPATLRRVGTTPG